MRLRWWRDTRAIEPRMMVNLKVLELQTAKEILAEVFHARPADVEEMIQRRLEERSLPDEKNTGRRRAGKTMAGDVLCG